MEIIDHPLCTDIIGKPEDMVADDCCPLPVMYHQTPNGPFSVSFWKPDARELELLNSGECVTLFVRAIGRQHPVVAVGTTGPDLEEPK